MLAQVDLGAPMRDQFQFGPKWRNFNHGSFGAVPKAIAKRVAELTADLEAAPDLFFRRTYPDLLLRSRRAVAGLLNSDLASTVFVPNATTGVNTVLRNIRYEPGDVIINLSTAYIPCDFTASHLTEMTPVELVTIDVTYPSTEDVLIAQVKNTISEIKSKGKNPRICVFDTISAMPGFRLPFASLIRLCREEGVLSLVDGAHGIGLLDLDITALDPDFFVSNLHKWLFNPRGCAVLYVAKRNQHLIRTSLPTSWGFITKDGKKAGYLKKADDYELSAFELLFSTTGTVDPTPYLVVPEILEWRNTVCSGEKSILAYNNLLAADGCERVAMILGTEVLDVGEKKMAMGCVKLPLKEGQSNEEFWKVLSILDRDMVDKHNTFLAFLAHDGKAWVRLSSQIYLDLSDFEWVGRVLKAELERFNE